MRTTMRSRMTHEIEISALEKKAPAFDADLGGIHVDQLDSMSEKEFIEEWRDLVVRAAIEAMAIRNNFNAVHFYLGRWSYPGASTHPIWGAKVVLPSDEVYNYMGDVTYIGWRVVVSAQEVDWKTYEIR